MGNRPQKGMVLGTSLALGLKVRLTTRRYLAGEINQIGASCPPPRKDIDAKPACGRLLGTFRYEFLDGTIAVVAFKIIG